MSKRKAENADQPQADSESNNDRLPNIIITGTPGTGKTTTSEMLQIAVPRMKLVNVGTLVKEKGLHDGWDEEWQSWLLNEDKVEEELGPMLASGGWIVDHHGCDFPETWFDLVVVLRADNAVLGKRLEDRGYDEKKITENIEAEIMQVVLEEARECFSEDKILELNSNSLHDMENNVARLRAWIESWRPPKKTKRALDPQASNSGADEA